MRLFDKARHCKTHCLNNIIFYQIRQLLFIKNISFGGIVVNQKKFKVGIIGATGMVGQRFALLLENHPWFEVKVLAASARSAGKKYGDVVEGRWHMTKDLPEKYKDMVIVDAENVEEVASQVDFCFCAVNMKKDEIKALEERYAKAECPIVSNNSAHRFTPDVPMVIPEINADHIKIIDEQRKRLGTKRGFIAVKSNCSLQSYLEICIFSITILFPNPLIAKLQNNGYLTCFFAMPLNVMKITKSIIAIRNNHIHNWSSSVVFL